MRSNSSNAKMYAFATVFLIFFIALSILSLNVVKYRMFNSSKVMGQSIAARFIDKELSKINTQAILLKGAADSLAEVLAIKPEDYSNEAEILLANYSKVSNENLDIGVANMCAIINGEAIGTVVWHDDTEFKDMDWYKKVLKSKGEVVYTDVYRYGATERRILTKAMRIGDTDNIVVLNVFLDDNQLAEKNSFLPPQSYYYLCDNNGNLIYSIGNRNLTIESLQPYVDHIIKEIKQGFYDDGATDFVYDLAGDRRGVYYVKADNGWMSFVTIPYGYVLKDYQGLLYWYVLILLVFVLFAVFMYMRSKRMTQTVESMYEVVRVMGNVYYAVYKIDYKKGTYTRLKGKDHLGDNVPENGNYNDLLARMLEHVSKDTYDEFAETFSLEHIRSLVNKHIWDFGGDFRAYYGTKYKWVNVSLLCDEQLSNSEVLMCFRDVDTEKRIRLEHLKITEDALASMKKTAESKNMFFSSMSHDMRTPLNGIIGLSDLAGKHIEEPDKIQEYLRKINSSSKQLLNLINDILDMSKMEHGKLETNNEPFDLQKALEDYLAPLEMQAKEDKKDFIYEYRVYHHKVCGDFTRIGQILNNIISNAIKYTPANGTIAFSVKEVVHQGSVSKYQFTVADTGYGMTDEFLLKIFEPFERDTHFGARKAMGTGLGMAIVKNLVTQMNGEIEITSAINKGTCVVVTLPLNLQGDCKLCGDQCKLGVAKTAVEKPVDLKGCKILVAEDNEINMEIVTELLQMKGIEVIQAWNGREAVEAFAKSAVGEISMILMDMQMPEMDGCEAAQAIRSLDRGDAASVPIIAVTANAFTEDISATMAAGMNAHISKPINFKVLEKTMLEFIIK